MRPVQLTVVNLSSLSSAGSPREVAVIVKGYPRLSETFIAQELLGLERCGLQLRIFSLRHPTDPDTHPVHSEIRALVTYLPEYLHQEPGRVARSVWRVCRRIGFVRAFGRWMYDFARDPTRNRIRRFGQAMVLAAELPPTVCHLYAHFLHTPASVARYAGLMSDLSWSCSAHAKDIWTTPRWEKMQKLSESRWIVTCTRANHDHLRSLASRPERVELLYHGLDFARFPVQQGVRPKRNGSDPMDPIVLLTVARAVEKKGLDDLLAALARLGSGVHWLWWHVGAGPLLPTLRRQASTLGLDGKVQWLGPLTQAQLLLRYREADLFVLPCRVASDGDRDGLPNVLMEAQSQRLACLATEVSGIPELIENGVSGVLVPERDRKALAGAMARLINDPELRCALGQAGYHELRKRFSMEASVGRLCELLSQALADCPR